MRVFRSNPDEAMSALLAAIYDAAFDPAKWQDFVNALHGHLDGVMPVLYLADRSSARIETLLVSDDWGATFLGDYMAHYNTLNPWTPHLVSAPTVGQPVCGDQLITDSAFTDTPFYNEFFKYWGGADVVGVIVHRDRNAFSTLGLHCQRNMLSRERETLRRLSSQLASHIKRAFEISRELEHGAALKATLELVLQGISGPALVIGADLRVRYANDAADELFRSGILALDRERRVSTGYNVKATETLRAALIAAAKTEPAIGHAAAPVVLTRSNDNGTAALPLVARVMPLPRALGDSLDARSPVPRSVGEASVLLLVSDLERAVSVPQRLLMQVLGLTAAEAKLAAAMAEGTGLKAYADAAGISEGTARNELKSVFAKTGTHRQGELVSLLARLATPLSGVG